MNKPTYDHPTTPPQQSEHWSHLTHDETNDRLIHNLEELKVFFRIDVLRVNCNNTDGCNETKETDDKSSSSSRLDERITLAVWSTLLGYMEALCTNKQHIKRYNIYPIPYDAIIRTVQNEFLVTLTSNNNIEHTKQKEEENSKKLSHRKAAKQVSNYIFGNIPSKSNVRDEKHANSLYIVLRGKTFSKSIDCFGAALSTVIGLRYLGYESSTLTLSEDHAYESHSIDGSNKEEVEEIEEEEEEKKRGVATCEVAIPGNTIAQRDKRGRSIYKTFSNNKDKNNNNKRKNTSTLSARLTPGTSWLYMNDNPVYCHSIPNIIAACLANVNCSIDENYHLPITSTQKQKQQYHLFSAQLFDARRDLLWMLHDEGYINDFPFALCELGDCEEHRTSVRGDSWSRMDESSSLIPEKEKTATISQLPTTTSPVLTIEALYDKAIRVSREQYNDGQVYPYCYAGHYHKDAGLSVDKKEGEVSSSSSSSSRDNDKIDNVVMENENEYRLSLSVQFYAEASRVASGYIYEWGDSLQLTKVMVKLADYILNEIVTTTTTTTTLSEKNKYKNQRVARSWQNRNNAICTGTWIAAFYDSLLYWEEKTGSKFLSVLNVGDSRSLGKVFSYFPVNVRCDIVNKLTSSTTQSTLEASSSSSSLSPTLQYFISPRSRRMGRDGMILNALKKEKISIRDIELAIIVESSDDGRRSRRTRTRR